MEQAWDTFCPWSTRSLPIGKVITIRDSLKLDGEFLIHFLASIFLHTDRSVCIVTTKTRAHFSAVLKKFGLQIDKSENFDSFQILSPLNIFTDQISFKVDELDTINNVNFPSPIDVNNLSTQGDDLEKLREITSEMIEFGQGNPTCFIIEDLTEIENLFGFQGTQRFVSHCRTFLDPKIGHCLVVRVHNDEQELGELENFTPSQFPSTEINRLANYTGCVSDEVVDVLPLKSGYSKQIHGMIKFQTHLRENPVVQSSDVLLSFQLLETGQILCTRIMT